MRKVVSFGIGVNGVAMLIAMVRSGERPDAILFANTGGERDVTYDYRDYFDKYLASNDFPKITVVEYRTKKHRRITLEQEILKAKTLPSIAFGFKTCSQKHKIFPQQQFCSGRWGNEAVTWYVGFDADEARRMKPNPTPNHVNKYPLIELGWSRAQCVTEIEKEGLIVPEKSSCFFCPNMKKHEILKLSDDHKARVVRIEENAQSTLTKVKGLGRRYRWTDLLNGQTKEADDETANQEAFKNATGEDLEPIICECI